MVPIFSTKVNATNTTLFRRNKDTLLSQAAALRTKMTRALTAPTKESTPTATSSTDDAHTAAIADAVAAGTLSTTAAAPVTKKANAIVVSMSTNNIPLEVSVYLPVFICYPFRYPQMIV